MTYSHTIRDQQLNVTERAREKLAELLDGTDGEVAGVRIYVAGGGCAGMNYGMTFAETVGELDAVLEGEGVQVVVDPVALNYLEGAEIDYSDDGVSATFVFNNVFQAVGGSGACGGCGGAF